MSNTNNRPRYSVCVARDTENGKSYFTRIGSAFEMKERKGLAIILEAHPIGDRILLFPEKAKQAAKAELVAKPSPESPLSFPLITEPVNLAFSIKDWEFFDGPEALFRRRYLEVAA